MCVYIQTYIHFLHCGGISGSSLRAEAPTVSLYVMVGAPKGHCCCKEAAKKSLPAKCSVSFHYVKTTDQSFLLVNIYLLSDDTYHWSAA